MAEKTITRFIEGESLQVKDVIKIILDVDEYKNFVPYCKHSRVVVERQYYKIAEILIAFSVFKILYKSEIKFGDNYIEVREYQEDDRSFHVFKHLYNSWKFCKTGAGVKIVFYINFEVKNKFLNKIVEKALDRISEIIVESFIRRFNDKK